ncbi:aldehyde dehydrogenase family protein [Streptomyces rapamycinicus]|uniref:aldehyde dehydrogenase (NAD(+)) n=2 Tax=Streptomyces rapamycinicus TaxID=1226757 RepID=A0A0A0N728_STRRN|nr:aldehyde dehydrogenase family protein [Streptomyces rapamycinicus]AGP52319.1 aldehyde dehydrogenase [Streptomyces rapamycinicus NRRL 5491]MBB4779781.1 aldehyde dehydrogenase (NAD+) [Streptomyces rapamycinicus]RLV75561.1 aldehyde dehydrogenase [Streptomyces rapamycinicus NRRL 5491]UTP28504.1 aldehyde dehydrogenase family protein [Streptomyces rapamycinicus NRRL 5491]
MTSTALPTTDDLRTRARTALDNIGVDVAEGGDFSARTPLTGEDLFGLTAATDADAEDAIAASRTAFLVWRTTPAPRRGELVRRLGELLREHKSDLADLVTIEAGKIRSEALGEIQEMIDICDFAVGLSRQLYGRTIASERPGHRLAETWHPLGVVGVISAFNFPAAVWSWNTAVALVCGDTVIWKPSELTPLISLACDHLLGRAAGEVGAPRDVHRLLLGDRAVGAKLADDPRIALVSATGSTRMGREVGPGVAARFGRSLLELGGNNAAIVAPSADLDLAVQGIVFAAAGTAGQRCTTLRRLIVHRDIADTLVGRLTAAYGKLPIGDPFADTTLVGPLISAAALDTMNGALTRVRAQGGKILAGGNRRLAEAAPAAAYVEPVLVRVDAQTDVVREETFAPILYVLTYDTLEEAIALHNDVPQGLSSSIFTRDQREAEIFLSAAGSDCGIANVNIGTSGAEIGGAFGGEKDTGGGRESGSDAWKAYMRSATNTINYSSELSLAQGVSFL